MPSVFDGLLIVPDGRCAIFAVAAVGAEFAEEDFAIFAGFATKTLSLPGVISQTEESARSKTAGT